MIGNTIGHFEIQAKAGAGGMGEVYQARDTRLNRTVAIKVLPAELAPDQELRDRLKREARSISQLNHPHVCTLYDIGHEDGTDYLVLEYLEGTSLADRLRTGPMPLQEALTIAAQIADGLDAAHRMGIVHRDLKPGNVMLTSTGAKLLDFGLAKENSGSGVIGSMMATQPMPDTDPATAEGTILGTLQYMSPEQLNGIPADARSDMFSFGAMLYEMVTGQAAFPGKTQASVIASILEKEPVPISEQAPIAPKSLERLITRCMKKDPDSRLQNARDAMHELQWIAGEGADEKISGPAARRGLLLPVLSAVAATVLVLVLVTRLLGLNIFGASSSDTALVSQSPIRATIPLPEGHRLAGWAAPSVAISDDGSTIGVVTINPEGKQQLYLRHLDSGDFILVPDSETAEGPVFSPDGKWVLFAVAVSGGSKTIPSELRKYSLESGLTQTLCPVRDYFGADWREDGTIVWAGQIPKGLWRIDAAGGRKENFLSTFERNGVDEPVVVVWPSFTNDGKQMLVSVARGRGALLNLESGKITDLEVEATGLLQLSDGRLVWTDKNRTLMVAPFDASSGRMMAAGRAVDRGLSLAGPGYPVFAVARNGTAVFTKGPLLGTARSLRRVVHVEMDGTMNPLPIDPGYIGSFAVSPRENQVVVATRTGLRIQNLNRGGGTEVPLGDIGVYPGTVSWSPVGDLIAFIGGVETSLDVYAVPADGTSMPQMIFEAESEAWPLAWEKDGKAILVGDFPTETDSRAVVFRVALDGSEQRKLELGDHRSRARLSPQNDLISYIQPQGDSYTVIVRSYPELGPKLALGDGSYWVTVWSEDGSTLYAFDGDGVDAFTLAREPELSVRDQRRLMNDLGEIRNSLLAPGGNGFFVLEDVPGAGVVSELEIVVNWVNSLP